MVRHWTRCCAPKLIPGAEQDDAFASGQHGRLAFHRRGLVRRADHQVLAGAWIAIVAMSALFLIMKLIRKHYDTVNRELAEQEATQSAVVLPSRNHALVLVRSCICPPCAP